MLVQKFVKSVANEGSGFHLDEAWRISEESLSVIVPVTRNSRKKCKYITFAEAQHVKVEDTGQIDFVFVENMEEKPLLISRGEIFRGKTQERAAIHGQIIMPGKGVRINVRCIHQSKGISRGADMSYGGKVPYDVDFSSQARTWDSVNMHNCLFMENTGRPLRASDHQARTNRSVNNNTVYTSSVTTSTSQDEVGISENLDMDDFASTLDNMSIPKSDDLVDTLDEMSGFISDAMKKIPPIENQVGAIFLYENKIKGLDIYDLPDSWKSVKEDVIKKEGSDFLKKEDVNIFEFKPEMVKKLIGKELACKFEEKVIFGETQKLPFKILEIREVADYKKSAKLLRGEAVEYDGQVIHLTMYRN